MKPALIVSLSLLFLCSCSGEPEQSEETATDSSLTESTVLNISQKGCKSCHAMKLDQAHDIECILCHNGNNESEEKAAGHVGLIDQPAHPDNMLSTCGQCHMDLVLSNTHSSHFTLKNEVNHVRSAFGAKTPLDSLTEIPIVATPQTALELADDLLRRRCLRCHPYFSGDRYPGVVRGTGCASCHLERYEGKLVTHEFMKTPGDTQCLQCHYGNWVGYDYYGRYEHDMNDEYRTPYTTRYDYFRPFGVEFHQLTPDIHQQKGLICVDCHQGPELMTNTAEQIQCADCHDKNKISRGIAQANIQYNTQDNSYALLSAGTGQLHPLPFMTDKAHDTYGEMVACQVCHAQWSFNDAGTNLMRSDVDEYDDFARLSVQGSFEVERIIKNNTDFDADELPHTMSDKINGEEHLGLWYKGYVTRRWEQVIIGKDDTGRLQVMRPLLDLSLSWIDEDETVRFDSIKSRAANDGLLPYVPHTTGKAGLFYKERIKELLNPEPSEK